MKRNISMHGKTRTISLPSAGDRDKELLVANGDNVRDGSTVCALITGFLSNYFVVERLLLTGSCQHQRASRGVPTFVGEIMIDAKGPIIMVIPWGTIGGNQSLRTIGNPIFLTI